MDRREHRRAQRNAGAFLGPDLLAPVPMRTLSDEYHDLPTEPEDDREPEPEPRTFVGRAADWLRRRFRPDA